MDIFIDITGSNEAESSHNSSRKFYLNIYISLKLIWKIFLENIFAGIKDILNTDQTRIRNTQNLSQSLEDDFLWSVTNSDKTNSDKKTKDPNRKALDAILKKSVITENFEELHSVGQYNPSDKKQKELRKVIHEIHV